MQDRDENGRLKLRAHKRGTFIYRLAGRDRQKAASYYTPGSLTRTVVKHAQAELVTNGRPAMRWMSSRQRGNRGDASLDGTGLA